MSHESQVSGAPVAVVTGAGGAIGAATCRRLVGRGYRVIAVDVEPAGLMRLGEVVVAHVCDLTDPAAPETLNEAIDRCDLLVHCAGIVVTTRFERLTAAELDRELGVNLLAPMRLTRALFPKLQASAGQVIAVASLAAMLPLAESPGYTASKFGLRGFLLGLAARSRETHVRVSIINPGAVDTPMLRYEAANGGSPLNFLGTPVTPDRIAAVIERQLDHPRTETNVPRGDGTLIKLGMAWPGVTLRLLPWLAKFAAANLDRYHRNNPRELPA